MARWLAWRASSHGSLARMARMARWLAWLAGSHGSLARMTRWLADLADPILFASVWLHISHKYTTEHFPTDQSIQLYYLPWNH